MKKRWFIFVIILTILPSFICAEETSLLIAASYATYLKLTDVFWAYPGWKINISGQEIVVSNVSLIIYLKNVGPYSIHNLEVYFNLSILGNCTEETKKYSDEIPKGYSVAFLFSFEEVNRNATLSEYDLPLFAKYYVNNILMEQTIIVPIAVSGAPILKPRAGPIYVEKEGYYNLTVRVDNVGTAPARHTTVIIIPTPPYATVVGDDWVRIGLLPANRSKTVQFTLYITELPTSGICIVINVTFMDERYSDFFYVIETVPIIIKENASMIMSASTYLPSTVFPGDKFVKIIATLINPTRKLLRDVKARLILPPEMKPSFAGANEYSLGSVPPGNYITLTFYIDIDEDTSPGLYNLLLNISHSEGVDVYDIPLIVKEKANFIIEQIVPNSLLAGARSEVLSITLRNIANVSASSTFVELEGGAVLKGELTDYLGEIPPNTKVTARFTIDVSSDVSEGTYSFDITITWTQEDRILQDTLSFTLTIMVRKLSIFEMIAITLGLIIALIILEPIIRKVVKKL